MPGTSLAGALHVTSGDFDGDGTIDLAIGEPIRELRSDSDDTVLDRD